VIGVWTIMYTEIFFLSRSLWLVVLMHTMEDALNPLISERFVNIPAEYNWLISPSLGIIPLTIYLCVGLYLRKIRKKRDRQQNK